MKTNEFPEEVVVSLKNETSYNVFPFDNIFVIIVESSDHMDVSFSVLEKFYKYSLRNQKESEFQKCLFFTIKQSQGGYSNLKGLLMSVQISFYRLSLLFKELSGKNKYLVSRRANASRKNDCHLNIWISFYLAFSLKSNPGKVSVVFLHKEYAFHILGT